MALRNLKQSVGRYLRRLPGEGRLLLDGYRRLALLKHLAGAKLRLLRDPGPCDPERVYCIDPARIVRQAGLRGDGAPRPFEDGQSRGRRRCGAEIAVDIGRTGEYLLRDGRRRLGAARSEGMARVPVRVRSRHRRWMEFRAFVRCLARAGGGSSSAGELYQNPVHPDLQDIPAAHGCEDRFAAIREAVGRDGGTLLDIGANLGYFCHRCEPLGFDCFAVEMVPQLAFAAEKIRVAEGRRFSVIAADLFAAAGRPPLAGRTFDVVLALNIFHHFLKRPDKFASFERWLAQLRARTMIFEPHCPDEPQMHGAYKNFDESEFVEFILTHSMLSHSQLLHRCDDGRPIYKLWC